MTNFITFFVSIYVQLQSTEAMVVIQGLILIEIFACLFSYVFAGVLMIIVGVISGLKRLIKVLTKASTEIVQRSSTI